MKIHNVLFSCFLSAMWDGIITITIHQKKEGTNFRIKWHFRSSESTKFLCRRPCKEEDILIKTDESSARNGSYSIDYKNSTSAGGDLTVSITNLTKPESGRYRFGLGRPLAPDSFTDFEVRVLDAHEEAFNIHTGDEGGKVSVACHFSSSKSTKLFCKNECKEGNILIDTTEDRAHSGRYSITYGQRSATKPVLRVNITNLTKSDSGRYLCGLGESLASASFQMFEISVTDVSSHVLHPVFFWPVVVCLPIVIVLLAAALLFLYRLKKKKNMDVTLLAVNYEHDVSLHSTTDDHSNQEPATV